MILRDYFQENRSLGRPFLLLRISLPGRPIFIQFVPVLLLGQLEQSGHLLGDDFGRREPLRADCSMGRRALEEPTGTGAVQLPGKYQGLDSEAKKMPLKWL